ncbi:MAG: tyrosine-type recombinase/integrase [Nitratireductor sp.]|nr:tyrosine-type recombinase/integrase [Nitratireductor sp.]
MQIYKRGNLWHYAFTAGGKRFRKSAGTSDRKLAAEIARAHEAREIAATRLGPQHLITFGEAVALYLDAGKSDRYLLALMDRFERVRVADITPELLRRAAMEMYLEAGPATRNRQVITPAQAVINHAADLGYCQALHVRRFAVEKVSRPAADWAWIDAFSSAARNIGRPNLAALAIFMFTTGARISQALAVRWQDVDFPTATVTIKGTRKGRSGTRQKDRLAPIVPEAIVAIAAIPLPETGRREPWRKVFGYNSRSSVDKAWRRAEKKAKIEHRSPHEAGRHGFFTETIIRKGLDPRTAAEGGGAQSVRLVMETYVHPERTAEAIRSVFERKQK